MNVNYDNSIAIELIDMVSKGDQDAFTRLYTMTSTRVCSYLRRLLRDIADVEDILVETYFEVWCSAGKFNNNSQVMTWILGISRNLAMNWLRRKKSYGIFLTLDDIKEQQLVDELDMALVIRRDRELALNSALMKLTQQQREILSLVMLKEFSYDMLSEILKIPVNTVKTRVFNAKRALREKLDDIDISQLCV